jgi:phosphodiesterase/alkaline phosphatase D-like protein
MGFMFVLLLAALLAASASARAATENLPDLDQNPPLWSQVQAVTPPGGTTEQRLGFGSEVVNMGVGPLLLSGRRASTATEFMTASQNVNLSDGTVATYPNVGSMRFAFSETHNHWHFIDFEVYELRRPSDFARVARDAKTGYCAGDGYKTPNPPPGTPLERVWDGSCRYNQTNALDVEEGISVGWVDDYAPQKEGQYIDVTNVPAGDYWLVNRSNPYRALKESNYANNAASVLVRLHRPPTSGPYVDVLKACPATQSCPQTVTDPTATTNAASSVTSGGATLTGSADPNGNDVSYEFEWGTTTSYGQHTGFRPLDPSLDPQAVSEPLTGLQPGTTYNYRLVVKSTAGVTRTGSNQTFTTPPLPQPPAVETGGASGIGQSGATIAGRVDPKGQATTWRFEYGTTTSYGSTTTPTTTGATSGFQNVTRTLSGLAPNTTYNYRLVATNATGTTHGLNATFKTDPLAPVATTGAATAVGTGGATVAGTIDPRGGSTSYKFEYTTSPTGPWTATPLKTLASPTGAQTVSEALSGLSHSTTYWYRLVAISSSGSSTGATNDFTTTTPAPAATTGTASNATQTTATLGGTIDANGAPTEYRFEYGTSEGSYPQATAWTPGGAGDAPVSVSAPISGLSAATTYHFRVVARSAGGTVGGGNAAFSTLPPPPTASTSAATLVGTATATLGADVDPRGGDTTYKFEYGTTPELGTGTPTRSLAAGAGNTATSEALSGLSASTTYYFRVVATNAGGRTTGSTLSFTTAAAPPPPPSASTGSASNVTRDGATVSGSVNPNGVATDYRFEYGTTSGSYETAGAWEPVGSGAAAVPVSTELAGLDPATTYFVRVVARSAGGTTPGGEQSFRTSDPLAPDVTTSAPIGIGEDGATLTGTVDPNDWPANYRFDYGTTTAYGRQTAWTSAGGGDSAVPVSAEVGGLAPATTYHYRLSAAGFSPTPVFGGDLTFTTQVTPLPPADPQPQPPQERVPQEPEPEPEPAPQPEPEPDSTFYVRSLRALRSGAARLTLDLPGPGTVTATAVSKSRTVAAATRRVQRGGRRVLVLRPTSAVRALLKRRRGLRVKVTVAYARTGAQPKSLRLATTLRKRKR